MRYQTDAMGNPISIREGVSSKTLTWGEGRMLLGVRKNASNYTEYTYNVDGLRTKKVAAVNGTTTTTEYVWGDNGLAGTIVKEATAKTTVVPHYDNEGEAIGFTVHYAPNTVITPRTTSTYTYVKNLQGDVIRILDAGGDAVVVYTYDPWGKPTVIGNEDLAALNPCSYRGYDYDEETGLYYVSSRYYDPEIGRFINADAVDLLGANGDFVSYNLFAYCGNNPIIRKDADGYAWETIWDAISLATSVAEVVANPYDPWAWIGLAGDAADVLIPFVGGIGETTRALKAASQAAEMIDTASDAKKGWKIGEDITSLTKAGNVPSWSTLRSRYWKNKAYYFASEYSEENVSRMMRGLAPQITENGRQYTMELHHILGREGNNFYFFFEITPEGHAQVDPFRFIK